MIRIKTISTALLFALTSTMVHAEINTHKFKLALSIGGKNAQVSSAQFFADEVSRLSDGKMTVELFPGAQLGPDLQVISGLRAGIIDATVTTTSLMGTLDKSFNVFDIPYLMRSFDEVNAVADGPAGEVLGNAAESNGIKILSIHTGLWRNLTNNTKPVSTVDDIAGLRVRTLQNEVFIDFWKAMGANPVAIPFPELHSALETGTVDAQENVNGVTVFAGLMDVQKHFTETRHGAYVGTLIFSQVVLNRLSDEEQAVIIEAGQAADAFWAKAYAGESGFLRSKINESLQVSELSDAEFKKLYEMATPVIEKHLGELDPAFSEMVSASINDARP